MAALAGMGIGGGSQTSFDATDVNDQMGKTLNKGGLLMRMAQSKGQQIASSRGLSNSTIGIDAAQRAVVDAALPIAQQNAQQNWTTGENSKDRSLQLTMQGNSFGHDKDMAGINFTNQTKLNSQQNTFTSGESALNRQQQLTMQGNDFTNQTKLNQQQNTFSAGQSALDRQQQTSILDKQQSFQSGQSALDRDQQLTIQGNEFKNQSSLTNQQAQLQEKRDQLLWQQQLGTLDKQGQLELQQLDKQLSNQQTLNTQQFGQQKELNTQQAYLQAERDTLQNKFQQGILDKEGQQRLTELDKQLSNQQTLNTQQFGQQKELNTQQAYLQAERDTLQNKFQQGILDKEGQQRLTELDKQLSSQKALNEQQNTYNSAEAQKDRAQQLTMLEKNASKDLAYMAQQVAANTHGMYLSAIDGAVSSYNERIAALEVAQDIDTTKKPEMKAGMEKELNATLQMYGQIYSNINTIRPDWTQFPTKVLPTVGIEEAPKKDEAANKTGPYIAAPIRPNVVATTKAPTKAPTPAELAARSPKKIAAPIRQLDNRR